MAETVWSVVRTGNGYVPVTVSVKTSTIGIPGIKLLGCSGKIAQQLPLKVHTFLRVNKIQLPRKKYVLAVDPAGYRLQESSLDVAIMYALFQAGEVWPKQPSGLACLGGLDWQGTILPVSAPFAAYYALRHCPIDRIVLPASRKIPFRAEKDVYFAHTFFELRQLDQLQETQPPTADCLCPPPISLPLLHNQAHVLRLLQIAAAGCHPVALYGPPGTGKTTAVQLFQCLLPPREATQTCFRFSQAQLQNEPLPRFPGSWNLSSPVRVPPTSSVQQLWKKWSTFSTPTQPVLLQLDDITWMSTSSLANLLELLEEPHANLPNPPHILATLNPCPCGYLGSRRCRCSSQQIRRYSGKLSPAMWDRFELVASLSDPRQQAEPILDTPMFCELRKHVLHAKDLQHQRHQHGAPACNAHYRTEDLLQYAIFTKPAYSLFTHYAEKYNLTPRRQASYLRVARTIADLEGIHAVQEKQVSEAIQLRVLPAIAV